MDLRSSMQMLNLGLSIVNKVQIMQQRQIRTAQSMRHSRNANRPQHDISFETNNTVIDADILDFSKPHSI
jgi:hypothetical protein